MTFAPTLPSYAAPDACPDAEGATVPGRMRGRRWGSATVRGRSMLPTLCDGDRLLVSYGRPPVVGDLIVVRLPGRAGLAVKRLLRAGPDGWWVERDNPREGVDSWLVGAVPDGDLVGVVVLRWWPRPARVR